MSPTLTKPVQKTAESKYGLCYVTEKNHCTYDKMCSRNIASLYYNLINRLAQDLNWKISLKKANLFQYSVVPVNK